MRSILTVILVLFLSTSRNCAIEIGPSGIYSNQELGFSLTPAAGLRDLTAAAKEAERSQTQDGRTHFSALLWMASGPDNTAADWLCLGIETYPRGRDRDPGDDVTAGFITNVSAVPGVTTERLVVKFSGQDFAMSRVEKKEPPLVRHAIVYTTVRKEQFVTFIFAGNSRERVEKAAQSMNTLKFVP